MKKLILAVVVGMSLLLTGCDNNTPQIDRRSRFQSGLDYKRTALSSQKFTIEELNSFIESADNYADIMHFNKGDAFWDSEDYDNLLDAKRVFIQTLDKREAGL